MALEKTLYIGTFVHSESLKKLDIALNSIIGVDEHGKIALIVRGTQDTPATIPSDWEHAQQVRLKGHGWFFPGFIDTHIHASQYPNAGVFGSSTLLDWLNTYTFPLESSFRNLPVAQRTYTRVVSRTLAHGTTTACYYATIHVPATNLLADICLAKGQRAFVGRVCMDQMAPDHYRDESAEQALRDSRECVDYVRGKDPEGKLVRPVLTPRFAPSCSMEAMKGLGAMCKELDVTVQTHISENKDEIALVGRLFTECETYAGVYDEAGLLGKKTILAHCVHLSEKERRLIREREGKISHCPASNTALTSGATRVRDLLDEGLTVGLGTDVSGGYTPSILAETREAIFVSRHVAMHDGDHAKLSVEEGLYLATKGGAQVVGLEDRIGGFEVGMEWDAQMIMLGEVPDDGELDSDAALVEIFGGESIDDQIAKWVYTGDDRNTKAVWVKGRLVHQRPDYRP